MLKLHPRANGGPEAWFPPSHGQVLKMATRHLTPSVSNPTRKKWGNTPKNNLKTSCNHALWEARWLTGLAVLDGVSSYISLFVLGLWFSLPSSSRLFLERQFRPLFSWMHSDSTACDGHRLYAFFPGHNLKWICTTVTTLKFKVTFGHSGFILKIT